MNILATRILMLIITVMLLLSVACSDKTNDSTASSSGPSAVASPATASPATSAQPIVPDHTAKGVIFMANPNPIKVCDGSIYGITTVTWNAPGAKTVEVHVGAPDGAMPARGGPEGYVTTHKWVGEGTVFYLQDVSDGAKPSAANTIGTVTVHLTTAGCP